MGIRFITSEEENIYLNGEKINIYLNGEISSFTR